jgi:hypothetical protein
VLDNPKDWLPAQVNQNNQAGIGRFQPIFLGQKVWFEVGKAWESEDQQSK